LQDQIWKITQAVARTAPTAVTASFVQSLNEAIDLSEKQIATLENRIPQTVWLMILIIAVLACLASGMALRQRMLFSLLLTPLMAAVVISLTADLDSPRSGLIRIGVHSLERVRADLHSSSAVKPH
jgi:L-asparagine transporter-like permease